jgi:RNA polymerase sigma factor (sigma-70 family)
MCPREAEEPDEELEDVAAPLEAALAGPAAGAALPPEAAEAARRERATLALYFREIGAIPLLAPDEERALARRVREGDKEAERRLAEANLRLVVQLARRYRNRGLPLADLIEEGNLALLHAVQKFDPARGVRFSTYATWWIRQGIVRALANQARTIRLPVHMELLLSRYRKAHTDLTQELGRAPTVDEVAARLGEPAAKLERLAALRQRPVSLETPVRADRSGTLGELVRDPSTESALATLLRERVDLQDVLQDLPDRERRVVTLRFGVAGEPPLSLEAIGRELGLTRERVRQLEAAALRRLRGLFAARGIDPSDLL